MKMRSLLLTALCSLTIVCFSQQGELKLGIIGQIESTNFDYVQAEFNTNAEITSSARLSGGLALRYDVSDKIVLTFGAMLSAMRFTVEHNYNFSGPFDPVIPRTTKVDVYSVRVPLSIGYRFQKNRFELIPTVGINANLLLDEDELTIYENDDERFSTLYASEFTSPYYVLHVGLAVNYNLGSRWLMNLTPIIGTGLNDYDEKYIASKEFNYGASAGFYYRLNPAAPVKTEN